MKILYTFLLLIILGHGSISAQTRILDLTVHSSATERHSMREVMPKGKNTLVMFSTQGCGWCKRALQEWQSKKEEWQNRYNLEIIVVIRGNLEKFNQYTSPYKKYPFEVYLYDGSLSSLGIQGVPTSLLFSYSKKFLSRIRGYKDNEDMEEILSNIEWETYTLFSEARYTIVKNHNCDNEEILTYSMAEYDKKYSVRGDINIDIEVQNEVVKVHGDNKSIYPFANILCDDIIVYDPINDISLPGKILDDYLINGEQYYDTDIPILNCSEDEKYLTIIKDRTTTAGALPLLSEQGVISTLACIEAPDSTYVFLDSTYCMPSDIVDVGYDGLTVDVFPNPAMDYLSFSVDVDITELVGIYNYWGVNFLSELTMMEGKISVKSLPPGLYMIRFSRRYAGHTLTFVKT